MIDDPEWWEHGKCQWEDPATFDSLPDRKHHDLGPRQRQDWDRARYVCSTCQVKEPCLEYVLNLPEGTEYSGFAAGHTPQELKALRNKRNRRRRW